MEEAERTDFTARYHAVVAAVWSDPGKERMLSRDPGALLAEHGIRVPAGTVIEVVRDQPATAGVLESQIRSWEGTPGRGTLRLLVPYPEPLEATDLTEEELDSLVAGLSHPALSDIAR
ncbi:hypothetical protein OOK31_15900 [Streptomyces sp. NBC_00249]|uniref:hypothetical protein n=1 Tax=Streptomyces sp. NBC_00249 TaxID=2975690 RepID=UPI00225624D0|nr:hypothetical protein [Streptomyces sp. NBC_00249]MCX5195367.1 hypothetical protein [Streptomyces sp. NBC_00249]